MKKVLGILAIAVLGACVAGNALALDFGTSWDVYKDADGNPILDADGNEQPYSLQRVFDDFTVGGPSSVDVEDDYLADEIDSYWKQTATGTSAVTMMIEIAGAAGVNKFGIYDASDPTKMIQIFDGSVEPEDYVAKTSFSIFANGVVMVGNVIYDGDSGMDPYGYLHKEFLDFGTEFGFYLDSSDWNEVNGRKGDVFYSDTSLNADKKDHMAAYQGTGDEVKLNSMTNPGTWTDNEFILAWEDLLYQPDLNIQSTDFDYNDLVVMVESVEPLPEPGTLLLLGAAE